MPLSSPSNSMTKSEFISNCMGSETMKSEFSDKKQRLAVCYSRWKKKDGKEDRFCNSSIIKLESKEDSLIVGGYIATTHFDGQDIILKDTLEKWCTEINDGIPRANKVSVHHDRKPHVAGVGLKGTAKVDRFNDGEYGLYVETMIDKTYPEFDDVKYRLENDFLDSFSIEYVAPTDFYMDSEEKARILDSDTELHGWTLASQPMNEHAIRIKELLKRNEKVDAKKELEEANIMTEQKSEAVEVKVPEQPKVEVKTEEDVKIIQEYKDFKKKEAEEKNYLEMKTKLFEEFKKEMNTMKVEEKVQKNTDKVEMKELVEYKEVLKNSDKYDINLQFKMAGQFADAIGLTKGGLKRDNSMAEAREYKFFSTNGNKLEYKGLGITTNQNSDTDYLLSSAELRDVFDPVIYNALNQATAFWNLLPKDDFSSKGNNQVQFTLKTAANTTAAAYLGDAVSLGNVTRLKYQTKFKKYQVGVQVSGDMIAASRGGAIGDVFAQEVLDSTMDMLAVINAALFAEVGLETAAGIIGLEYLSDSAGNTSLYNLTRSTTNKLAPDSAGDTYVDGASATITIPNLRGAIKQALLEGANRNKLIFVTHPTQMVLFKGLYDDLQRLVPTSMRVGFEGMPSFDGIPIYEDKDCTSDNWHLVDLETHRVAIWVPPTLEMLGKDSDAEKGFIKSYFAVYNRAPRRCVMIYDNATS